MNAQQAPSLGLGIFAQQSFRSVAPQIDSKIAQSKKGGTTVHKIHNDNNVSDVFRRDEKRLILIHAKGPVVLTGGGRSGCAPTGYLRGESGFISMIFSVR